MKHGLGPRVQTIWQLMLGIVVGTYWIYLSANARARRVDLALG